MDQIYKRSQHGNPTDSVGHYDTGTVENLGTPPEYLRLNNDLQARMASLAMRHPTAASTTRLTAPENEKFLEIVKATSGISCHYDLFQLLQNQVQYFVPHKIFIAAWGDFSGAKPNLDVISAIRGVRTGQLNGCGIEFMLKSLFTRWVSGGRKPMLLDGATPASRESSSCNCALHSAMGQLRSMLVHGIRNERDELDSLYIALSPAPIERDVEFDNERNFFLIDSVIGQIDMAYRKVAALKTVCTTADRRSATAATGNLSPREQEILKWITAGKTNAEIAAILGISSFTVKNHAQRIFRKLDVGNRTEAASKHRQDFVFAS
jgi:transcriptional regulator EpsA